MKKKKFHAIVRKNKANQHKYITVPKDNPIKAGDSVKVEAEDEDNP